MSEQCLKCVELSIIPYKINNLSSSGGDGPEPANKLANRRFKIFSRLDHGLQVNSSKNA